MLGDSDGLSENTFIRSELNSQPANGDFQTNAVCFPRLGHLGSGFTSASHLGDVAHYLTWKRAEL